MLAQSVLALFASGLMASAAHGQSFRASAMSLSSAEARQAQPFRVPRDKGAMTAPSTYLATIAIAPGATFGVGRFNAQPRRRVSLQDAPISLEPKKVRRAAVGVSIRF